MLTVLLSKAKQCLELKDKLINLDNVVAEVLPGDIDVLVRRTDKVNVVVLWGLNSQGRTERSQNLPLVWVETHTQRWQACD